VVAVSRPETRISLARDYLEALARTFQSDWLDLYQQYKEGQLPLTDAMALAHPENYPELHDGIDIRGERAFPPLRHPHGLRCESALIWGYTCGLDPAGALAADHLFPWAMGGPTVATNQVMLCRYHNLVKTSDVHVYPWERGEPQWLREVVDTLARRHRELRRRTGREHF
jgi:hypothetical protein